MRWDPKGWFGPSAGILRCVTLHPRQTSRQPFSRIVRLALVMSAIPVIALLASCGSDAEPTAKDATTAPPQSTQSTTSEKKDPGGKVDQEGVDAWARTAGDHRGEIGRSFEIDCPPNGTAARVWGTNVYTDDSSVCTAAVHVGLITLKDGGKVTFEIVEGQQDYFALKSNGIDSTSYGPFGGSFKFPDAKELKVSETIGWDKVAASYGSTGESFTVDCAPGGTPSKVWGTDVYTADSSICTAAQHAGLIDAADGGTVTFDLLDGQDSYRGTTANGVTSEDYGSYGASFKFIS